jgi:hypothetical protein
LRLSALANALLARVDWNETVPKTAKVTALARQLERELGR